MAAPSLARECAFGALETSGAPVASAAPAAIPAAIVLVGNPNVGKSALFGALTGTYVTVSNYPGTTVEVARGIAVVGGERTPVVDTPGVGSLLPCSEDERVTRDILLSGSTRAVVAVGDAKNLERALLLSVQLGEMGLPFVLCLNMMDEAEARGMGFDLAALSRLLGVAVTPTVAVRDEGLSSLKTALEAPRPASLRVEYPPPLEAAVAEVIPLLPPSPIAPRALALMTLAGDATLAPWLRERMSVAALSRLEDVRQRLRRASPAPLAYVVSRARLRLASRLARNAAVRAPKPTPRARRLAEGFERLSSHRVWGFPILMGVLYLTYLFVGELGAGTLVDLLEEGLFGGWINPAAAAVADRVLPWSWLRDLLVGPYGVISMALTYSLALVLPIVGSFFVAFGILEDSGYLPRLAVMVNRGFKTMGLNGKAVLPMVLGLGCDTMATLTTRILETPKERLIVILLLALGVPCSAQLAVILALLKPLPPIALVIWVGVVLGVIFTVGRLAARVLPGRGSDFILELPPMRVPRPGNILVKTLARIEWYLKEAVPLFVLGTLLLFVADRLRVLGFLERLAAPIVQGLLGLPAEAAVAFIIGFLRRDFGAAGLYRLAQDGRLDPAQVLVAVVTMTLFIPCMANFLMIVKERGWRTAVAVAAFVFPFAVMVGGLMNAALRIFPVLP